MSRKTDSPVSRGELRGYCKNGTIGFPSSHVSQPHHHLCSSNSANTSIQELNESYSDLEDDDDSCDSCTDLTEKYYRRNTGGSYVKPTPVKTFRPAVRFEINVTKMEGSDTNVNKSDISADLNKLSRKGPGSLRYTQPRLSLLGKPISYKLHRRDLRYRRIQAKMYNFLERPKDWISVMYHIGM